VLGGDVSAGGLIGDSFRLVARFVQTVALFALLAALGTTALDLLGNVLPKHVVISILLALAGGAMTTIVEAAWISLLASAATGTALDPSASLRKGLETALPLFGCNFVAGLAIGFGTLLFIVPGIILGLGWALAAPAVVAGRRDPMQALGDSWYLTTGHKLDLLLAFFATGGIAVVISIGLSLAVSLISTLVPQVPGAVLGLFSGFVENIAAAPIICVSVLAYLRLNRHAGQ
jgi:hypothetical protein